MNELITLEAPANFDRRSINIVLRGTHFPNLSGIKVTITEISKNEVLLSFQNYSKALRIEKTLAKNIEKIIETIVIKEKVLCQL